MGSGKIDSDKKVLQKIFSPDFWFLIPEYQRSYVWQTENIIDLIDDLYYAFTYKNENEYFLGSLVLKRTDNDEFDEYEVLDGQQRLTTFFLMFAVLRDLLENPSYKDTLQQKIYQRADELLMIPERQRITYQIRDDVEGFIKKYVIEENGTSLIDDLKGEREKDNISISNMANALLVLREQLQEKDNLDKFVQFILNKALLIYVSTDNTEDAFRMFTILNDRGIPLTSADILKSMNIGHLNNDKDIKKYAKYWEEIEGRFGEGFDRFFNFIRTIIVKEKARSNLLDEFEEKIYKLGKLKKGHDTLEFIKQYDEVYQNVIELEDNELSNQFKNLITIMKIGLRSEDWIPAIMFYYAKFKHQKLDEFLKKLEFKFVGDWVVGVNPTPRLEAMNTILKAIQKANNPDELLENKDIFKIDLDEFKRNISSDIYKKQYAKYLLLKIEYLKSDNTVHLSGYKNISVEHILPQHPNSESQWAKDFTEEEHKFWVDKIANLVLINKRKNSSLSNLDFIEKKKRYLNGRIDVFRANKVFIDQKNEWTPEVLRKRENEIVEMLIKN
ncbi:DUF262 domain-containing HNH endonuclease family protein [Caldibacillus thermoamylovorans]|uniref:DUF262 domain-containing protein n=1 Tax=Bacillaceae TaxID=186817 RepID=UPI000BA3DBA8|nr:MULTISPECIES: DUF262 domain-containing protein [Bacillaceae]MCB5935248.1 DUF262 domain-containing HNH endonuclease family protein [Bacillus sp. DFI.2.34]MCB7077757.1 DUF262 domain-containing HNH endonuclease family protein [Caldibacillus thermoamylovorans]MCM3055818.1 DUF262 domain-containing HNH endonuclease family protein [Caldibacillus thermoamylovorans]MED3644583.1 DUF262 domain-containing HNH endonuclease family protein [Caldifermentibacillus hisashii]PAC33015.1 hypothetical protein CE